MIEDLTEFQVKALCGTYSFATMHLYQKLTHLNEVLSKEKYGGELAGRTLWDVIVNKLEAEKRNAFMYPERWNPLVSLSIATDPVFRAPTEEQVKVLLEAAKLPYGYIYAMRESITPDINHLEPVPDVFVHNETMLRQQKLKMLLEVGKRLGGMERIKNTPAEYQRQLEEEERIVAQRTKQDEQDKARFASPHAKPSHPKTLWQRLQDTIQHHNSKQKNQSEHGREHQDRLDRAKFPQLVEKEDSATDAWQELFFGASLREIANEHSQTQNTAEAQKGEPANIVKIIQAWFKHRAEAKRFRAPKVSAPQSSAEKGAGNGWDLKPLTKAQVDVIIDALQMWYGGKVPDSDTLNLITEHVPDPIRWEEFLGRHEKMRRLQEHGKPLLLIPPHPEPWQMDIIKAAETILTAPPDAQSRLKYFLNKAQEPNGMNDLVDEMSQKLAEEAQQSATPPRTPATQVKKPPGLGF